MDLFWCCEISVAQSYDTTSFNIPTKVQTNRSRTFTESTYFHQTLYQGSNWKSLDPQSDIANVCVRL